MYVAVSAFLGLVDAVVVCGNIFVLYLLASQPSLRSSTNSLVLSLTLSDLLLGILILPFSLMQEHHGVWLYGKTFCDLWLAMDVFFSSASIYNLLAISVDRYMAVSQPIRYPIISSKRMVRRMIATVWIAAAAVASVIFIIDRDPVKMAAKSEGAGECSPLDFTSEYIIGSASASFVIPAIFMIVLNLLIFRKVLRSRRSKSFYLKKATQTTAGESSMRIHRGTGPKNNNCIKKEQRSRSNSGKSEEKDPMIGTSTTRTSNASSDSKELPIVRDDDLRSIRRSRRSTSASCPQRRPSSNHWDVAEKRSSLHVNSVHVRTLFSNLLVVSLAHTRKRTEVFSSLNKHRGVAPSLRTELRVARTTSIVVLVFIICWFPFMTIYLLQAYGTCTIHHCVPGWVFTIAFWLGYANSAFNPILYAAFSRDFRAAFRRVLLHRPKRPPLGC